MHHKGFVHRDIKVSNIYCKKDLFIKNAEMEIKIGMFSIGEHIPEFTVGGLGHFAPEILRDNTKFSVKSDIWALGVILYELFTLEKPFKKIEDI